MVIADDTNVYMDATTNPATEHFRAGWEACGFRRATAGGAEDMIPTLHSSRHRADTFLVNEPLLPWSLRESVWARGMAHPEVIGSDHLPVRLALSSLQNVAGQAALPAPCSHTEGRLLPYDTEAAPVQRCLWAAVTAAQDEPSLAPWLGPAEQQAYGSMPAAAVDTVFEHLHAAHDALARVVGRPQPFRRGRTGRGGNPLRAENGSRRRSSATTHWLRARRRRTKRTPHGMASGRRRRSGSRKSCGVRRPGSAWPRRASYRRSWRGKQPASNRTSATFAHSWRLTASAPSKISGTATPRTSPSGGKLCGGP